MNVISKFWDRVDVGASSDCWEWRGYISPAGYGILRLPRNRKVRAHRFSFMLHFGPFDRRALICHHCDNAKCVNPAHLYLGDAQSNMDDQFRRNRRASTRQDACRRGHPMADDNLIVNVRNGRISRQCRSCWNAWRRQQYADAKRQAVTA